MGNAEGIYKDNVELRNCRIACTRGNNEEAYTRAKRQDNYKSLLSSDDFRLRDEKSLRSAITQLDGIKSILANAGRTIAQGAIAWNWARSETTIPIIGFRTFPHIQESIKALDFGALGCEQMREIDSLLGRPPQN